MRFQPVRDLVIAYAPDEKALAKEDGKMSTLVISTEYEALLRNCLRVPRGSTLVPLEGVDLATFHSLP